MTTIAYRDGVIAYDSRAVQHDMVVSNTFPKMFEYKDHIFFVAGDVADYSGFANDMVAGKQSKEWEVSAFMVCPDGKLWMTGGGGGAWRFELPLTETAAIGSGMAFALAGMDFGLSAKKAVKYAMTRDPFTGGKVRTYMVGG